MLELRDRDAAHALALIELTLEANALLERLEDADTVHLAGLELADVRVAIGERELARAGELVRLEVAVVLGAVGVDELALAVALAVAELARVGDVVEVAVRAMAVELVVQHAAVVRRAVGELVAATAVRNAGDERALVPRTVRELAAAQTRANAFDPLAVVHRDRAALRAKEALTVRCTGTEAALVRVAVGEHEQAIAIIHAVLHARQTQARINTTPRYTITLSHTHTCVCFDRTWKRPS